MNRVTDDVPLQERPTSRRLFPLDVGDRAIVPGTRRGEEAKEAQQHEFTQQTLSGHGVPPPPLSPREGVPRTSNRLAALPRTGGEGLSRLFLGSPSRRAGPLFGSGGRASTGPS